MLGHLSFTEFMASLKLVVVAERMAIGNAFVVRKIAEVISTSLAWVEQDRFD
jgi:putative exporter of polyketide antibiotics